MDIKTCASNLFKYIMIGLFNECLVLRRVGFLQRLNELVAWLYVPLKAST